jgi:hypothetical protein
MRWTPDLDDPELFHITHVDNLASISAGGLISDARVASGAVRPTTIGDPSIKRRRLSWRLNLLPDRPCVGEFVPFYFCPRSIMLYLIQCGHAGWSQGQDHVAHLVTRVSRLVGLGRRIVFTDCNAATSYHHASDDLRDLATLVNWNAMPVVQWQHVKEARQAEFLVLDAVPWTVFERVIVRDPPTAAKASLVVAQATHRPLVGIDPTWYY